MVSIPPASPLSASRLRQPFQPVSLRSRVEEVRAAQAVARVATRRTLQVWHARSHHSWMHTSQQHAFLRSACVLAKLRCGWRALVRKGSWWRTCRFAERELCTRQARIKLFVWRAHARRMQWSRVWQDASGQLAVQHLKSRALSRMRSAVRYACAFNGPLSPPQLALSAFSALALRAWSRATRRRVQRESARLVVEARMLRYQWRALAKACSSRARCAWLAGQVAIPNPNLTLVASPNMMRTKTTT